MYQMTFTNSYAVLMAYCYSNVNDTSLIFTFLPVKRISIYNKMFMLVTWQMISLLVNRTTKRYFGVLYLFLS